MDADAYVVYVEYDDSGRLEGEEQAPCRQHAQNAAASYLFEQTGSAGAGLRKTLAVFQLHATRAGAGFWREALWTGNCSLDEERGYYETLSRALLLHDCHSLRRFPYRG